MYEDLFYAALQRFRQQEGLGARKQKFRFKNKLLSLDSTTITLCLELFPWAKFRTAKGGVKAHVLLDHDDYLPRYVLITEARCSDVKMTEALPLNSGSIVVMDRGYNDYALQLPPFQQTASYYRTPNNLLWHWRDLDRLSLQNIQDPDPKIRHPNLQVPSFQQTASQPCPILDSSDTQRRSGQ